MDAIMPVLADDVSPAIRLGLVRAEPVAVGPTAPPLDEEIRSVCSRLAARHAGRSPAEIPGLAPARVLYRAFGMDPTRTRPSSEALLRRVLQGKPFPRISNAVDLCNLCAILFLLPIGLYDREAIEGAVTVRRGAPDEWYPGIRKDRVHLAGRPVLADRAGAFGNPTSDSARTSVHGSTRSLWMVIFAPAALPREQMDGHVREACALASLHLAPPSGSTAAEGLVLP